MAKTSGGVRDLRPGIVTRMAKGKILSVLSDIRKQGFSRVPPFKIGGVEKRMSEFAVGNGIELGSRDMYMSSRAIAHATRDSKRAKGLAVPDADLADFPSRRKKMSLYYDSDKGNFTYTDGKAKYVIHPNYRLTMPGGKKKVVNFITASRTDGKEFNQRNYTKIR
ncbi:unknown [Prevotella sp. CAG:1320]|nr:unknown [Prevotella sp. CAG:1320]